MIIKYYLGTLSRKMTSSFSNIWHFFSNYRNSDGSTPKYSQDDSVISYGAYNSLNNLCTKCSNRDCQRDFIQKDLAYHQHPNTFDSNTCIDLANIQKLFRTNPKMLRVLGRGCLLILFVLFSCLGLLYSASTKETKDLIDNQIELGGPNNFHAVSVCNNIILIANH